MTKSRVKDLERQLGYGVEPHLSNNHNCLETLKTELNGIKNDYEEFTPKALENDASFRIRCERLFHKHGARIWTGHREDADRGHFTEYYPRYLIYTVDQSKLFDLFYQLILEKCRVYRSGQLNKVSRDRRTTAAGPSASHRYPHLESIQSESDRPQHACDNFTSSYKGDKEDMAANADSGSPTNKLSPPTAEEDLEEHAILNLSDPDDADYQPSRRSQRPSNKTQCRFVAPTAHMSMPKRLARKGHGGADIISNLVHAENDQPIDGDFDHHEQQTIAETARTSASFASRSLSPIRASNTLKRKGRKPDERDSHKRPRTTYAGSSVRRSHIISTQPSPDPNRPTATDEDSPQSLIATFKFPRGFTLASIHCPENVSAAEQLPNGDSSFEAPSDVQDHQGDHIASQNDDADGRREHTILKNDVEAEAHDPTDIPEYQSSVDKHSVDTHELAAADGPSSCVVSRSRSMTCGEGEEDQPINDSRSTSRSHASGSGRMVCSPSFVINTDGLQLSAKASGKQPVRPTLFAEDRPYGLNGMDSTLPMAAYGHRATEQECSTPLSSESCQLLVVDWRDKSGNRPIITRLTRQKPGIWDHIVADMPDAYHGQRICGLKLGIIKASARQILQQYGESVELDAMHDCLRYLMDQAYGASGEVEKIRCKITVSTVDLE